MLRPAPAFLVTLGWLSGCSFAFVHGPPPNHERLPSVDCTTSNVLPVLDAVFAGLAVADAVGAATGAPEFRSPKSEAFAFAAEAVLVGASAGYGFSKTSQCRQAQELAVKRAASQPTMPVFAPAPSPRLPPAPPPVDPWTGRPFGQPPAP
ncbi:MAG TPA: hypothetical protein VN962_12520 [Polyangia bacterium]|nr:hypothetical protein [Polyangia bacterium]